ncbi:hypothetical protein POVWA2_035070 [Plasmodium ovale wallikeri]|uniref:Uncharacterized protein n=1 Tax=Plasmodium ovale wallikeri TaxID=864142 RepID=A0A1A8Z2Z5_PLAOA|nr:hypothetical protein POVWA2_035070 [Plasmodium ovale wallikeri]
MNLLPCCHFCLSHLYNANSEGYVRYAHSFRFSYASNGALTFRRCCIEDSPRFQSGLGKKKKKKVRFRGKRFVFG